MLALLLDENLSPKIAHQIGEKRPDIPIISVHHWQDGKYKAESDETILLASQEEGWTLVTYDQRTILPVLVQWGQVGANHGGVIFVDDRTIFSHNIGAIVRALIALWDAHHADNWINRVDFLRAAP